MIINSTWPGEGGVEGWRREEPAEERISEE